MQSLRSPLRRYSRSPDAHLHEFRRSQHLSVVAVIGLGDLGTRVFYDLARCAHIRRLVGTARDFESAQARVAQTRLIAEVAGGPLDVSLAQLDLSNGEATASFLLEHDPDVCVLAASRYTWWRDRESTELARLPYGVWLPLQASLAGRLMEARAESGSNTAVVCLPYPDAVGPLLATTENAPLLGAGNVAEAAAKLQLLAAQNANLPRAEVDVRLVMHHAGERAAFRSLSFLGGPEDLGEPPWVAEVRVNGALLGSTEVAALFREPFALPGDATSHELTAACVREVVEALLGDEKIRLHAPAPNGRPGGYPVRVRRGAVELDLPPEMSEQDAIAMNEAAAAWDGIAAIEHDGTIVFTPAAAEESERILGLRIERVKPTEREMVADELAARLRWRREKLAPL